MKTKYVYEVRLIDGEIHRNTREELDLNFPKDGWKHV